MGVRRGIGSGKGMGADRDEYCVRFFETFSKESNSSKGLRRLLYIDVPPRVARNPHLNVALFRLSCKLWPFLNTRDPPIWKNILYKYICPHGPPFRLICGESTFVDSATGLIHYSTATKFVPLSKLITGLYPSVGIPQ